MRSSDGEFRWNRVPTPLMKALRRRRLVYFDYEWPLAASYSVDSLTSAHSGGVFARSLSMKNHP